MPPDSMTVAITSGFGIGIIAGIVSGVCYILVHGLPTHRQANNRSQWHCGVCGEQFRSIEGILEADRVVTCSKCLKKVCRNKCSNQDQNVWTCQICKQPESWFKGILKALNPNNTEIIDSTNLTNMDVGKLDEVDEDLEVIKNKEKEQVREFIEKLVETMLGGGIDSISVTRLYNDQQYDNLMTRYHSDLSNTLTELGSALHMSIANLPIIGQSPCSAHAGLKLLIQRIIQEAIGLPLMKKVTENPGDVSEIKNRTYEDLLATAIINKVVESYQEEISTSSANSASSKQSNSPVTFFFGEETLDSKWKKSNSVTGDVDTTSVSSLEEWVRSDSSTGSTKYVDHRSLTIKQGIREVSSSDEEDVQVKHKKSNWKENWTFQKRQFANGSSPTPVPMLVPNPTIEAKVLIGDREADDTSDLSDIGSDYGDAERVPALESLLVDSKTIIGGKNPLNNLCVVETKNEVLSDISTDASDLEEEKDRILDQLRSRPREEETSMNLTYNLENVEPTSFDSHVEQDLEHTERYPTLPRTIVKETAAPSSEMPPLKEGSSQLTNGNHKTENGATNSLDEAEDIIQEQQFEGSYSTREKQKWEHAVEMKNNPYTEESIKKRLILSTYTDVSSLYGRDYYIKEAARAAGARKTKVEDGGEAVSPKMQEPEADLNGFVYQAVPALIEPEDSQFLEGGSPIIASPIPPNLLEISSDSDLSIERVYNLNSGKVFETVGGFQKEIVKRSASPEGITFNQTREFDRTFTITDENHNSTALEKQRFLKSLTESEPNETEYIKEDIYSDSTLEDDSVFADAIQENGNENEAHILSEENHVVDENNSGKYSIQEFTLEFSTDGENRTSTESSLVVNSDPEIVDLKDKHLVKDKLGLFSKSYPNLASVPLKKTIGKIENNFKECVSNPGGNETLDTSVNDLRKKFDNAEIKDDISKKPTHSITARSIPQAIKKQLQEVESDTTDSVTNTTIAEEVIIVDEEELNYFPNARSRITFFENLNR